MSSAKAHLSVSEAAEELGISAKSVRKPIHGGVLVGYKFTARIVIRSTDLEEFKLSRGVRPSAPNEEAS